MVFRVRLAGRREAAVLGETIEHVLADAVERVVAGTARGERGGHDRLVDERSEKVGNGRRVETVALGESVQRGERSAATVNRELLEQGLLVAMQEVVAPPHELLQSRAGGIGGRALVHERRAPFEHREELGQAQHVDSGCGELDRQRQAVHAADDLGRKLLRIRVRLEPRSRRPGSLEEQLHARRAEWSNRETRLARDMQRFPARGEDLNAGTVREEGRHDASCLVQDVLARVENDERARRSKPRRDAGERIGATDADDVRE